MYRQALGIEEPMDLRQFLKKLPSVHSPNDASGTGQMQSLSDSASTSGKRKRGKKVKAEPGAQSATEAVAAIAAAITSSGAEGLREPFGALGTPKNADVLSSKTPKAPKKTRSSKKKSID